MLPQTPQKLLAAASPGRDLKEAEIHALLSRCSGSNLSSSDIELLDNIIKGYFFIHERLASNDLTLQRLRKLLGMIASGEKRRNLFPENNDSTADGKNKDAQTSYTDQSASLTDVVNAQDGKNPGHGKSSAADFEKPEVIQHDFAGETTGDTCPHCLDGKLYVFKPSEFVRIVGQAPLKAEVHVAKQLRCNTCGDVFRAPLPAELLDDGPTDQRFGYSARALIGMLKYGAGTPFFRQYSIQRMFKIPLTPSTLWDQVERLAGDIAPVFESLKKYGAENGIVFYADDTSAKILSQKIILKENKKGKLVERSGINTSGVSIQTLTGQTICLYKTGVNHAGEFMDELLQYKTNGRIFVYMSDGLSSNNIRFNQEDYFSAHCNAHARRQFVDIATRFPDEAKRIIDFYAILYKNDAFTKTEKLTSKMRLDHHREHSLPVMGKMFTYLREKSLESIAETNNQLGIAIQYFLKRESSLKAFCTYEHAPIDNNLEERKLKAAVLQRKNSLFFKETIGAKVSDIVMSLCQTAVESSVNVLDYLTVLQRYRDLVKNSPTDFFPWNYRATLAERIQKTTVL